MPTKDPYEVLGVARDAGADQIKSAYRRLARRYHPDVNPDNPEAEEKFKEIGEAYSILSDPERKARFDQYGVTDEQAPGADFFGGAGAGGFGDLFDVFFGNMQGGGRRGMGRDGDDLRADVQVTLKDVLTGLSTQVTVSRKTECSACKGSGSEGGKAPETCSACRGQGAVTAVRNTFIGQVRTQTVCPTCAGAGLIIKDPCRACRGAGVTEEEESVAVTVPPGIEHGMKIHVPGQGDEGSHGGRPGDLYVFLSVRPDPRFERRGQTLFTRIDLTFAQAALGDEIEIDGVDASVSMTIPPGTQPGHQIAVRGAGLPPLHGGRRGDLIVQTQVLVPEKVTEAEAKLIRELAELRGETMPKEGDKGGFLGTLFGKKK